MNEVISQDEWRVLWRKWNTVLWKEAPLESAGLATPWRRHWAEAAGALQTHEFLKPEQLRFPCFLTALPPGLQCLLSELPFIFFLQTDPVKSKRYHSSLSMQRVILQLHDQGKTDFLEGKEEDMECCGCLRDARFWEFSSLCLEVWGQRQPSNAVLSSVWLYLGSIHFVASLRNFINW